MPSSAPSPTNPVNAGLGPAQSEQELLRRYLVYRLNQVVEVLAGLTPGAANQVVPSASPNSLAVLATHVFGNANAWIRGIACNLPVTRRRSEEFKAHVTSMPAFERRLCRMQREIERALDDLPKSSLDDLIIPPQQLWGEGASQPISRREVLLHVLEHASVHYGQMKVLRRLVRHRSHQDGSLPKRANPRSRR